MAIPQSFVQELLSRLDIVEVVGRYVPLKKGGVNFMGLCPFHGEKSPSFSVHPNKQFFHCFGCGKHGNAIGFVMDYTGMGFVETVKDLAQQTGLQVPQEAQSAEDQARFLAHKHKQTTLSGILETAAQAYRQQLKHSPCAIDYLKGRGLSGQVAKTFALGYAPDGWRFLSTALPDYQDPLLVEAGLVIAPEDPPHNSDNRLSKRYDRFRDRIMFPIRNLKGEYIGFGGRVLDQGEPKYLNSPETPVFSKGQELYGLFEARQAIRSAGYALVTEGYMDVVALAQLGFAHAVATLGTACTADHLRLLLRHTDAVVFSFDGDAAGRRAARKALEAALPWASDTRSIKFLFLPEEHDPDSYIRTEGPVAFATRVQQALPLSQFLQDVAAIDCDLHTAEGRARMSAQAQTLWSALPDGALKRQILKELAQAAHLESTELEHIWFAQAQHKAIRPLNTRVLSTPNTPQQATTPHGGPDFAATTTPKTHTAHTHRPLTSRRSTRTVAVSTEAGLLCRSDRVARLILNAPQAWEWLSDEDQQLLADEPAPYGALFTWLEQQWHEHGPQAWPDLRAALSGERFEDLAQALYHNPVAAQPHAAEHGDQDTPDTDKDLKRELRDLMRRLHIEAMKQRETELIARAAQDPSVLQEYRMLQLERKILESDS